MEKNSKIEDIFSFVDKREKELVCLVLENGDILPREDSICLMVGIGDDIVYMVSPASQKKNSTYQHWCWRNAIVRINGRSATEIQKSLSTFV